MRYSFSVQSFLILIFVILTVPSTRALDKPDKYKGTFGIKAGFVGGGVIDQNLFPYEAEKSYSLGLFADQPLSPSLFLGFNIDYHIIDISTDESKLIEISLSMKGIIPKRRVGFIVRPGVSAGYGYISEIDFVDNAHFFMIKGFTELIYFVNNNIGFLVEVGGMGAPLGGNSKRSMKMDLRYLIRFGVIF